VEALPLARGYAFGLFFCCLSRGSDLAKSPDESNATSPCKQSRDNVVGDRDLRFLCFLRILGLAYEGLPLVRKQSHVAA